MAAKNVQRILTLTLTLTLALTLTLSLTLTLCIILTLTLTLTVTPTLTLTPSLTLNQLGQARVLRPGQRLQLCGLRGPCPRDPAVLLRRVRSSRGGPGRLL